MGAVVLTVDLAVLAHDGNSAGNGWHVLLVRRGTEPFRGRWALPGGKVRAGEDAPAAACRELREETGVQVAPAELAPVSWHTAPDRDPRGRYVSLVYAVLLPALPGARGGDDAAEAWWQPLPAPPDGFPGAATEERFAFDHAAVLLEVLHRAPHGPSAVPHVREATAADGPEVRRLLRAHGRTAGEPTRVAALGGFLVGCALPHDEVLVHRRWQGLGVEGQLTGEDRSRQGRHP
ncbi:NUDIX domain-containing protein [Streptomyces morookaense]|uniref:AzgD n=1 Tax=Streptomyces morookaense TaxID=1970 RepID=A0A6M3RH99_STRMO|nr:NUDIX domain-containing protein [Streptomyces morookaense]NVK76235.1 NUDIX domain-containing protein [Streptomyces morookaense]QJD07483.1 AzgD [Streptomyces morookaense]GHF38389.1 hypothetical protein GCM10010359_46370 [Streptomyces morookaense]